MIMIVYMFFEGVSEIPDGLNKLFEDILTRNWENMEDLILCLQ